MATFDYGNYGKLDAKSNATELARLRKEAAEAQIAQTTNRDVAAIKFPKSAEKTAPASANEALGLYGVALTGLGTRVDVSALGLTPQAMSVINTYVTSEQQANISADMLGFMAIS